jgi:hypothetical protein
VGQLKGLRLSAGWLIVQVAAFETFFEGADAASESAAQFGQLAVAKQQDHDGQDQQVSKA